MTPEGNPPEETVSHTDEGGDGAAPAPAEKTGARPNPARDLSLHLLRMLETRMDAAGVAVRTEVRLLATRLKLKLLAGAVGFLAAWAGIVLLAVALPEHLRIPVLSALVAGLVLVALVALWVARRRTVGNEVGSLRWFLHSLRQDLELFSRALSRPPAAAREGERTDPRSPPHDLAA